MTNSDLVVGKNSRADQTDGSLHCAPQMGGGRRCVACVALGGAALFVPVSSASVAQCLAVSTATPLERTPSAPT